MPHRPALDGVRGLAILLVLGHHVSSGGRRILPGGFVGVDVFFVVSGALITMLLLHERETTGRVRLGAFWARRAIRLLPALLAMLAVVVVVTALAWSAERAAEVRIEAMYALFYLSSFRNTENPQRLLSATWSLSVEEWFYLAWPPLLVLLVRIGRRAVALGAALFVVTPFAWRVALFEHFAPYRRIYFGLDTRADALAAGCACGVLLSRGLSPRGRIAARVAAIPALTAIAAAALYADWRTPLWTIFGYSAMAIASACVVVAAVETPPAWLAYPPLVWIGRLSYSLYLWMLPAMAFLDPWPPPVRVLALFGIASLSYYAIERPASRLRARWGVERSHEPSGALRRGAVLLGGCLFEGLLDDA